jgi:hypothetical protein
MARLVVGSMTKVVVRVEKILEGLTSGRQTDRRVTNFPPPSISIPSMDLLAAGQLLVVLLAITNIRGAIFYEGSFSCKVRVLAEHIRETGSTLTSQQGVESRYVPTLKRQRVLCL